jgi:hypothetical protein
MVVTIIASFVLAASAFHKRLPRCHLLHMVLMLAAMRLDDVGRNAYRHPEA